MFMMGIAMVYCTKCGTENEENALECKNCGSSMRVYRSRERTYNRSEEDWCFGGRSKTMWPLIIGVFIILIGLSSLLEDTYSWARFDNLWPLLIIGIGLMIIYTRLQGQQ
jgi:uncharacterized membrane protein YvbJ